MSRFILITVLSILLSCDDGESPTGIAYFTITVDPSYLLGPDDWILVHDADGTLIETHHLKKDETFTLRADVIPAELSITILSMSKEWITLKPTFNTYGGLKPDQHWTLKTNYGWGFRGTQLGVFTVFIPQNEISPFNIYPSLTDRSASSAEFTNVEGTVRLRKDIFTDSDDLLLILTDANGEPRYKFFPNALPGEYTYSIDEFENFEKTAKINFPPSDNVFLTMRGYEAGQSIRFDRGYIINHYYNYGTDPLTISSLSTGYLDILQNYKTTFRAIYDDKVLTYESIGNSVIEGLTIEDDFGTLIMNTTFGEFALEGNDYKWFNATWKNSNNDELLAVTWNIEGPKDVFPKFQPALPTELLEKYPDLNGLQYDFEEVTIFKSTMEYEGHLSLKFIEETNTPFETRSKTFD
jgi:hypothetical protein